VLIRMARSSTIEVLRLEYITHARAKGLREFTVAHRHALKNAMAPTWTMIGLALGSLLGGAVVTETVFTLPASAGCWWTASSRATTRWCRGACSS
jgi:peptide/nickel transport system permease protein